MTEEKKYTAFISYNSRDNRKARWLQKKLESYNLPSVIANEKGEILKSYDEKPKKFGSPAKFRVRLSKDFA